MKKFLLITCAVIAVLAIALRVALPYLTKQAIIYGVESSTPYQVEVGDVSYDVMGGKAALTDVTLRLKDVIELGVKDFNFDLIWQPLLSGKVAVDKVQLAGVTTRMLMDKERLEVAGYDLNAAEPEEQPEPKEQPEPEEQQTKGDGTLPVVINGIDVADIVVDFVGEGGKKAKFLIEKLKVSSIDLSSKEQAASIDAQLKIDKSPIAITGAVFPLDLAQTSALKVQMTKVNLGNLAALVKSKMPPGMTVAGILDTNLDTTFAMQPAEAEDAPAAIDLTAKGTLGLASFDFKQPDMAASFKSLALTLDNGVKLKGDKYHVTGPAKVNVGDLAFAGKDGLNVKAGSIAIAQALGVQPDRVKADGTIKVSGLNFRQPPTLATVATIDLQTEAQQQGEALAAVVSGKIADIVTTELPAPPAQADAKAKPKQKSKQKPKQKPSPDEPTFQAKSLTLNKVALSSIEPLKVAAKRITLSDFVLAYPYKNKGIDYDPSVLDLSELKLTLDKFNDGSQKGQKGKLAFATKIGKTGTIDISGQSTAPAVEKTNLKLKAKVDALDLTDFSGFFMQQMGYRIERGSLNADVKVAKNTKDDLDGNAKILLAKLQVSSKDRRGKTLKNRSNVPLESSLSMTKNDSDNLPLEFPISGNLNSPSFSPRVLLTEKLSEILVDQLTQSLGTAIVSNYLPMLASSAALSPVMVYSLLKKGVDVATKLRFKAVTFSPNSVTPTTEGMKTLRTVSKNLGSRPNLILKFCSKAYYSEGGAQPAATKKTALDEAKVKKAFALADKRLSFVRRHLRRSKKIKAKQIVTCKPTLEPKHTKTAEMDIAI